MGDNGFPTESYFMENNYDLNADVLEVGHHGSKNSTSSAFINRVTPKTAIFSFGYNNYGHPAETVAEKLYKSGCSLHYIHVHGSITVNVYNKWYNIMNSEDIEYYGEK